MDNPLRRQRNCAASGWSQRSRVWWFRCVERSMWAETPLFSTSLLRVPDKVYGGGASSHQLFSEVGRTLVRSVLEGYNSTIFTYGQTAAGKTFTMQGKAITTGILIELEARNRYPLQKPRAGTTACPGIIPLAVQEIMAGISQVFAVPRLPLGLRILVCS